MICLDYRRTLLAGLAETGAMQDHRLQCPSCAAYRNEHAAFELELRRGLEVALPAQFQNNIDTLANPFVAQRRRFLAAAAVSTLAVGAGIYAWLGRDDQLALACITFVMKDEAKSIMMGAMPRAQAVTALAATLPLDQIERIGQIRHIAPCPFNGVTAYHVILAVPQGKVTLLVMPGAAVRPERRALHEGMYATVIALRGGGVGIIGTEAVVVDSVAGALRA